MKNLWSKARDFRYPEKAYLKIVADISGDSWVWYVLKAYQSRSAEIDNLHARWLCLVVTPFTGSSGDIGDTYVSSIPLNADARWILQQRLDDERVATAAAKGAL